MAKREYMPVSLDAADFIDPAMAMGVLDPANDHESAEASVDCDIDPPDASVGCYKGSASLCSVITGAGVEVSQALTEAARTRLEEEYLTWAGERLEAEREYAIEARYEDRLEDIRERRRSK
jgi:hypothetical protein